MTQVDPAPEPFTPLPKARAPGLDVRAPRPPVARLRKSVVQGLVITGAVLVSGSLAWAFVIQPDLRQQARDRAAETRDDARSGEVRPSEAVTDQPASYDALPEPRTFGPDEPSDAVEAPAAPDRYPPPVWRPSPAAGAPVVAPGDLAARSDLFFEGERAGQPGSGILTPTVAGAGQDGGGTHNAHRLVAPLSPYELKAGAVVPAALLTGVDTARSGPVVAMVTQNVFDSVTGRHLLLPQGTRLIGRHDGDSAYGDRRAFLTWDRLILPNGKSLILGGEPGVDAQGAVGVRGEVDRRLFPLVVGTLFAGAITTLGQVARDQDRTGSGGLLGDAGDAAAIEGSRVGGRLVDRELEVSPSIRLRPGVAVRVLITRDLILEPYRS